MGEKIQIVIHDIKFPVSEQVFKIRIRMLASIINK